MLLILSGCKSEPPCECKGEWHKVLVTGLFDSSSNETHVIVWGYDIDSKKENQYVFTTKESLINKSEGNKIKLENSECINICVESTKPFFKAVAWYPCDEPCDIPEDVKISLSKLKDLKSAYILGATKNNNNLSVEFIYCDDWKPLSEKIQKVSTKQEMTVQNMDLQGLSLIYQTDDQTSILDYKGCAKIKVNDGILEFAKKADCSCGKEIEQEIKSLNRKEILKESANLEISWSESGTDTINVQMYSWGLIEKEVTFTNKGKTEMKMFCYLSSKADSDNYSLISNSFKYDNRWGIPTGKSYMGIPEAKQGKYDYLQCIRLNPYQTKKIVFPIYLTSTQQIIFNYFLSKETEPFQNYQKENADFYLAKNLLANIEVLSKTTNIELIWETKVPMSKLSCADESGVYDEYGKLCKLFETGSRIIISTYTGKPEYCNCYFDYTCIDVISGKQLWKTNLFKKYDDVPCCHDLDLSQDSSFIDHYGFNDNNYRIKIENGNLENMKELVKIGFIEDKKRQKEQARIDAFLSVMNTWKPNKIKEFEDVMSNYILGWGSFNGSDYVLLKDKVLFFVNDSLLKLPGRYEFSYENYSTLLCFDRNTGDKLYEINYELFDNEEDIVFDKYLILETDLFDINTGEYIGKFNSFMANEYGIEKPWHKKTIGNDKILLYANVPDGEKRVLKMKMIRIKN